MSSLTYPLFVFAKDDSSMRVIAEESGILRQLEATDIENEEYVFWDVNGASVSISVSVGPFKSKLESVALRTPAFPIREAFMLYAKTLGVAEPIVDGAPMDIWNRMQSQLESRSRKRSLLSKLFSR